MDYPEDFPPESRAAVAAEKLRAGKDFDEARKNLPGTQYGPGKDLEAELRRYILRQFSIFGREACQLGHKGIWHVDQIEEEALEFLRRSTNVAISSKGYDKSGRSFGQRWMSNWGGGIEPDVKRQFEQSDEWKQFQNALLQVAESHETRTPDGGADPARQILGVARDSTQSDQAGGTLSKGEDAAMTAADLTAATTRHEPERSALVETFLLRCNEESAAGFKVIRKHIWLAAGHRRARQFQYWQERSEKATDEDDRNFHRILRMPPSEFIALLKKKGISLPNS
ncbi:MAG TPA: hypothetical protein VMZ27_10705 [Candidatus Saccharimonadales bacterium]|nr:hypothetical protein [Candidatus Saccharimonadales bacterium]